MVVLAWFVLCLGLGLNVAFLFLIWARLGDIHWCIVDLAKVLEKHIGNESDGGTGGPQRH
jgi:hypothetical protein